MTIVESLLVSVYGMSIVFAVLVLLSFLVMLQSKIFGKIVRSRETKETVSEVEDSGIAAHHPEINASSGELKLNGVDDSTAAMIMAIVSDKSGIPLSELQFKTIKVID